MLPANQLTAVVLGIMQDAGLPHAGCRCRRCMAAWRNPAQVEYAACLAMVDTRPEQAAVWLIDATPDIKWQLNWLAGALGAHSTMPNRLSQPDGLFLTHAHMGHTAGLVQLGPEGMNVRALPVCAPAGLVTALQQTRLWQPLVENLDLRPLSPHHPLTLAPDLTITAIPVPHRDELQSGTVAFRIAGPNQTLLYLPDIDGWEQWSKARAVMSDIDVALVDASFYSAAELGGRPPVAHPLVPDTLAFWKGWPGRLILTHLNHTNPLLDTAGVERQAVKAASVEVAFTGQIIQL